MEWFTKCIKHYADFSGRARRREYWMFTLWVVIISMGLGIIGGILDAVLGSGGAITSVLSSLFSLFLIVPSLAVTVRRLHDINKSGYYWFINLIPVVGSIILLVWVCTDSYPVANEWGENPKAAMPF